MNINKDTFNFADWDVKRRARALDNMDQFVQKNIKKGSDLFFWELKGVGNKSDEEVLEIASNDTAFINVLFAFYVTVAGDDPNIIKKTRF